MKKGIILEQTVQVLKNTNMAQLHHSSKIVSRQHQPGKLNEAKPTRSIPNLM